MHMTWKMRLLAVLTMGVMLAAVSLPAFATVMTPPPPSFDITTQLNPQTNVGVNTIADPDVALAFGKDANAVNQSQNAINQNQANQSNQVDDSFVDGPIFNRLDQDQNIDQEQNLVDNACSVANSFAPNGCRVQIHTPMCLPCAYFTNVGTQLALQPASTST